MNGEHQTSRTVCMIGSKKESNLRNFLYSLLGRLGKLEKYIFYDAKTIVCSIC